MENWQREIIEKNVDKLVELTTCNFRLLTKLLACGILSDNDVEELSLPGYTRAAQSYKFYKIVVTRTHGFDNLLESLQETKQTGALDILSDAATAKTNTNILDDIQSITYDDNKVLGRGSYGTVVYKGKFEDRPVAVKLVHSNMMDRDRAVHEIKALKTCDVHENIVRYFGSKQTMNFILIALELCDMSLNRWIETENKSMSISPIEVLRQITVGLEWLHNQEIVHRDLKPENILLMEQVQRVKISDFGLSRKIVDGRSCVSSSILGGTQGWVAPEILAQVIHGDPHQCKFTFASDVFALGCVYYYVLTNGKHPFGDLFRSQVNIIDERTTINSKDVLHGCGQNLLFIRAMISTDPKSRPSCFSLLSYPIFWPESRRVASSSSILKPKRMTHCPKF